MVQRYTFPARFIGVEVLSHGHVKGLGRPKEQSGLYVVKPYQGRPLMPRN